ncbi:MAG: hypothetical protein LUG24_00425 [Clostridiales bacterium]|nr:hypothetical protein [Clostridiales bacterium]
MIDLFDQEEMYKIHEENLIAESRAKAIAEGLAEGRAQGIAQGHAQGHAQGRAEGEARGREKGNTESKESVAMEMIKDNYEPIIINKLTQIPLDRINELRVFIINQHK